MATCVSGRTPRGGGLPVSTGVACRRAAAGTARHNPDPSAVAAYCECMPPELIFRNGMELSATSCKQHEKWTLNG